MTKSIAHLVFFLVIALSLQLSSCFVYGDESPVKKKLGMLCSEIRAGKKSPDIPNEISLQVATYLFRCAIGVYIGESNESIQRAKKRNLNKLNVANRLFENGLDFSALSKNKNTLIIDASKSFVDETLIQTLIDNAVAQGVDVNHKNAFGRNALDYAVFNRKYEIMATLLKHGANIDESTEQTRGFLQSKRYRIAR